MVSTTSFLNSGVYRWSFECLECNGDVKRAAGKVGKHENTVRFRIGQAKNLLNLDDYEFIEKVSIALKARDIFGQQMGTN